MITGSHDPDVDADGPTDIAEIDTNADGYVDVRAVDFDRDGVADVAVVDYDGRADAVRTADSGPFPAEPRSGCASSAQGLMFAPQAPLRV